VAPACHDAYLFLYSPSLPTRLHPKCSLAARCHRLSTSAVVLLVHACCTMPSQSRLGHSLASHSLSLALHHRCKCRLCRRPHVVVDAPPDAALARGEKGNRCPSSSSPFCHSPQPPSCRRCRRAPPHHEHSGRRRISPMCELASSLATQWRPPPAPAAPPFPA
jgi:hypothetical protein